MPPAITLRPVTPADLGHLREVYFTSRADEMAQVPWTDAEKSAFLLGQFETQDRAYRADYPNAAFDVIELDGVPVGRIYLDRTPEELHLMDIALLPAYRGRGIGTALLLDLLAEARATSRSIRLYVEHQNPARRLYQRLGFTEIEEHGPYSRLDWLPVTPNAGA